MEVNPDIAHLQAMFPELTEQQSGAFARLYPLYKEWNERINVVSRKDIGRLYLHHILHSLAIAKFIRFLPGATVLDVGTGGGFPGIPLAILFPESTFTLVDAIGKKITVVKAVTAALQLQNVQAIHARAESVPGMFDFVVSRAVTVLSTLAGWVWPKITPGGRHAISNGIICLKGGNLDEEIADAAKRLAIPTDTVLTEPLSKWLADDFFAEKKIVYIMR